MQHGPEYRPCRAASNSGTSNLIAQGLTTDDVRCVRWVVLFRPDGDDYDCMVIATVMHRDGKPHSADRPFIA
jgi:hypothetical protein